MENSISRRNFLGVAAGTATMMTLSSVRALAAKLPLPSSPVVLNIVDAAGNLALTQPAFDNYSSEKSNLVSRLTFNKATAPELPGKIRAQQAAKRLDIDLVIVGLDALSAGLADNMWIDLISLPDNGLPDMTVAENFRVAVAPEHLRRRNPDAATAMRSFLEIGRASCRERVL